MATEAQFWPEGIRLVISISMQFEAGGQPAKGTDSPFPRVDFPESVRSQPPTRGLRTVTGKASRACSTCGTVTASR